MKKLFFSLLLTGFAATGANAQSGEGYDICQQLAQSGYSSSANSCLGILSRGYADPSVTNVCRTIARGGYTSTALSCLEKAVSFRFRANPAAMGICERLASTGYTSTALSCIDNLNNARSEYMDRDALQVCSSLVTGGYTSTGLSCLQKVAGNYYDSRAVALCQRLVTSGYTSTGLSCLDTIANRSYDFGLEICSTMLNNGSTSAAISCLQQNGRPVSGPIRPVYPVDPVYPSNPNPGNPPPVQGELCFVAQTGEWVDGDRFFSLVNSWVQRNNRCAVAKIATVPFSGRVYDSTGRRVAKEQGGLSNSQVDDVLRRYGLYGCERFTCTQTR